VKRIEGEMNTHPRAKLHHPARETASIYDAIAAISPEPGVSAATSASSVRDRNPAECGVDYVRLHSSPSTGLNLNVVARFTAIDA
jgi:hypothetical protein